MLVVTANVGHERRLEACEARWKTGTCTALVDTWLLVLLPLEGDRREVAQRGM